MSHEPPKIRIIWDTLKYTAATYVSQGLGMVTSILLRRLLGPTLMGVWSVLQVILGYCGYASFGTTKAMARDYPYLKGRGETEKAEKLKDMVTAFSMVMSVIPAAMLLGYATVRYHQIDPFFRSGLYFLAGFLFLQRFYDIVINLLRSDKRFGTLSTVTVANSVMTFLTVLTLVAAWKLYGIFAGTVLTSIVCLVIIFKIHPYRFTFSWNNQQILRELKLGVPLVATGFLLEFLRGLDRIMIAKYLGFDDVGLYSIAIMANSYIFSMPMMFSHVWYPNLQEAYGRENDRIPAIKQYLLQPVDVFQVLVPYLTGLGIYFIPAVIHTFIPRFNDGIPALKIYLTGTFFLIIAHLSSNFLVTIDKYFREIPALAAGIVVHFSLSTYLLNSGRGIESVALSTALSFALYGLSVHLLALRFCVKRHELFPRLLGLILFAVGGFAAVFLIDQIRLAHSMESMMLKSAVLTIVYAPFFWVINKKTGLFRVLKETLSSKLGGRRPAPDAGIPDEPFDIPHE